MDRIETLGKIEANKAEIKRLQEENIALQKQAITKGWAMWTFTVRQTAPSLAWWKEHRPATWEKYATETQVKKFTLV